jgi:FkbM family methyltransferase
MLIDNFITAITPHIDFTEVKTILDIGTRDLEQSIELHRVFPNAVIHAFEPNPQSYQDCLKTAKDHPYITVWPLAILDYDGETIFYAVPQDENKGASSIFEPTENVVGTNMMTIEKMLVPAMRIDTWAKKSKVDQIDLAWVDVQGAEIPTFESFGKLLDGVQAIATEAETGAIYFGNKNYDPTQYTQLKDYMDSRGFVEVAKDQPWEFECDLAFVRRK